jgi:carboxyl-terminal processing protease
LTQNFSKIEKTAKNKVFDTYSCKLSSILNSKNGLEYDLQNIFLNIFCSYFDPHTNYFSLDDKSSFLSGLSKSNYSLGLSVTLNDKDEIVIDEIVPSGPAAKTGKFDKDDIITKVSNNKGEEYLVSCASLEKIGELIFSDANQEILLTIQKKNGIILNVLVKKQLMKATENSVYSFIAQGETKIGYINIPSFYADFEENTNQGCADDVAKEIEKLKKDAIQGLVLDLRNNGGGSMEEATKLAGMFIDMGPVAIMADNKHTLNIIKDYNRGSVYDGPIVIIINGNSASASEFFSGVMQDYNRAIIVGSPSLGKASMQSILPIDDNRQEFVKLTIEKFYRITGESCQIKGVIPDITLPVLYQNIFPREESNKTALRYDILHTTAKFNPFPRTNIEKVIALSNARTKNNTRFNDITLANKEINAFYNNPKSSYLLSFKNVYKDTHKLDVLWKKIKILSENNTKCSILNTSYDIEKLESDAFLQDGNDYRIKEVKTNPYLDEAISIINDYNRLNK